MDTNLEKDVDVNEVVDEKTNQETEVPTVSPVEAQAREGGWVSKEEWVAQGKDPDDWRTAREFTERGELFEEIHKLKENTKKTTAAFKALVEHHRKVRETAIKEAMAQLKAEKRQALENHEIERVMAIDERMEAVREGDVDIPNVEIPEVDVGPTPVFSNWHRRNSWYKLDTDDEASRYADTVGISFKKSNPNASERELLEFVESKVARRFPEVFENPNAKRPSEVNPSSDEKASRGVGIKLSEEEEKVCKLLVDQGVMTRKQYIDEIKKTRGA